MEYICPKCKKAKIIPIPSEGKIWICQYCGYKGKPIMVSEKIKEFWKNWIKVENV